MNNASHALGDYEVGKRIASGGFGFVYAGRAQDGKRVAIKYERTYKRILRPYLQHEADVYRLLEGDPCVPKVHAYGREGRWNIMVFDMLGTSLETLFEKCKSNFSLKTMLMLAPQMIECVEYIHSKGIIHRDIKPDNFLMGLGDRANLVHIIDFGLARRFRHPKTLEHFPYFEGHNFFGTTRFASLKALEGCSQSRRDDLESTAYSLVYFVRGRLPWQGLRGGTEKHRDQRVREKKRTWTPERLCEGLPGAEELIKMLQYIKSLGYTDEPDYAYLKGLFRDRFKKEGFDLDYDYDWLNVVESERESAAGLSITVSRKGSGASVSDNDKNSVDLGIADDEPDAVAYEVSRSPAGGSRHASGSVVGKCVSLGTDSQISALTTSKQSLHERIFSRSPKRSGSHSTAPSPKDSDVARSVSRSSSISERNSIAGSDSQGSSLSSDSSSLEDLPVKKGDFVLIKFLARPTLEKDGLKTDSSVVVDNSYWHQPSLSEDEWHFPFRPAVVTQVDIGNDYMRLSVLPIMRREGGLEKISPVRRSVFFQICTDKEPVTSKPEKSEGEEDSHKLQPTPAWPLDGTYVHHQYNIFRFHVPADSVRDIKVAWRLEKPQLKKLLRAREDYMETLHDNDTLSDAGSETGEVRRQLKKRRVAIRYALFGEVASLNEEALDRSDVEFKGSNGWLDEFLKTDRRRNHENGYYTGDSSEEDDDDDENLSMYSGRAPGNRRLSCTLALEGDVILEAASQASSDCDSHASFRYYRSSRSSKAHSHVSQGSSRHSKSGSAAGSAVRSARSLRHVILDRVGRSSLKSPAVSSEGTDSDAGSSRISSPAHSVSVRVSSSDIPSHASFQHYHGSSSGAPSAASAESKAGSSVDSSVGSFDFATALQIVKELEGSIEGLNENASAVNGQVMVDKAIQTDATDTDELAPPTSAGSQVSNNPVEVRA